MLLTIFGLYALVAGKFQVSKHYGLKGKGARIAGAISVGFGLGFFSLFAVPIVALTVALGFGEGGALVVGLILQVVSFALILVALVRVYGNAFAAPALAPVSGSGATAPEVTKQPRDEGRVWLLRKVRNFPTYKVIETGPHTANEIDVLLRSGSIRRADLVSRVDEDQFRGIGEVLEFADHGKG